MVKRLFFYCTCLLIFWSVILYADTHYVSPFGTNNPPYTNWADASTKIQDAIYAASAGDIVLVTNGIYSIGGIVTPGGNVLNRIVATNAITIKSTDGPEVTIIVGQGPRGPSAVRCAYLSNGAILSGFTLTNGHSWISGDISLDQAGGGVYAQGATVSNCWIMGNSSSWYGGGAFEGNINNCLISENTSSYGGGTYGGIINNCIISSNSSGAGGGTSYGTISNCTIIENTSNNGNGGGSYGGALSYCEISRNIGRYGGGVWNGIVKYCTINGNVSSNEGGGTLLCNISNSTITCNSATRGGGCCNDTIFYSTISSNFAVHGGGVCVSKAYNCLIISNVAIYGGGASSNSFEPPEMTPLKLNNCTVVSNSATSIGGGIDGGSNNNCIIFYNSAPQGQDVNQGTYIFTCTPTNLAGAGNITNEPFFVNHAGGDFHLSSSSMCINAGNNIYVTGTVDLDGSNRVQAMIVDIGAYESPFAPIDASSYAHGSITPAGRIGVPVSNDLSFTMTNSLGYPQIRDVIIDGISIGPTNNYTFFNIKSNHTIEAVFWVYPDTNGYQIMSSDMATSGNLVFNWLATNGWYYTLQQTPTLNPTAWVDVAPYTNMIGLGEMVITNNIDANETMFYRLKAIQ